MTERRPSTFDSNIHFLTKDFELRYSSEYLPRKRKRASDSVEFFFFLDGRMFLRDGNDTVPLKKFDVVYLPQGTVGLPLIIDESRPNTLFFLRISKNYISQLKNQSPDYGYLFDFTAEPVPQLLRNEEVLFNTILARLLSLADELRSDRFGRETQIYLALDEVILHLNRMAYQIKEETLERGQKSRQTLFRNLVHYIEMHIDEELTLDHLAEVFFVSKYYIAHLFKDNLGSSVHQYITKKRLALCRDALLHGGNISALYHLYGFKDYSTFYRAFRKEYGLSPKAYKEQIHRL